MDGLNTSGHQADNGVTTSMPTLGVLLTDSLSAIAACPVTSNGMTSQAKLSICKANTPKPKSSKTSGVDSTISVKGLNPYWDGVCEVRSSLLWLPTKTDLPVSDLNLLSELSANSVQNSWFSVTVKENPNKNLPKIYSPSFMSSLADFTECEITRARKIKMLPTRQQEKLLNAWMGIYRFIYNETVWMLNGRYVAPNWMAITKWLIPELVYLYPWTEQLPRAMRDGAVQEAVQAVLNAIAKFKRTNEVQRVSYKSRKDAQQSFFLRNDKWSKDRRGFSVRELGKIRFAESLPDSLRDGRVVKDGIYWYVALPETKKRDLAENQGRLCALDPGVRTFQTFFSDHHCGHLGEQDVQRITRLAFHLDDLTSRRDKATNKRKKSALTKAMARIGNAVSNLIDELHWKTARFLTDNFDVILLPTFESSQMVIKADRKIRSKTVRSMLTLKHYTFSQRLEQKCFERGKVLIRVCEAYTSKTASWTGEIIHNLGGRKTIKSGGFVVDRDENGARGIFLRALVDSPILIESAC
ncbi:MAG: hypothetical protein BWK73_21240 [Thiothrix lacustris]|uniref:Transposase n=1 Tax=Thiothrix lacustris TaxID=525917 RepID=A0A1Y1QNJ6_9GAMM|nr:MAG: hypothetical protein BWK73_21240 [Thiothrix lacustris]